jgi:phospho-N-acetylmuramoyl-pentapeptide-transferase
MVRVLIAGLVAMVIAVVIGPTFIDWLRRRSVGQQIRAEGPAGHHVKQGTPTMGGMLILFAALAPFLVLSVYTLPGLTVMGTTLGCGLIGFADDYLKVRRRRSLGLPGRWKMLGLLGVTVGVAVAVNHINGVDTQIYVPILDWHLNLSYAFYPFLFLLIAGTVNGVNLTDGLDGLAAGTSIISLLTFLSIAVISWIRSNPVPSHRSDSYLDLAIFGAALIGGVIGFLWFNAFPAEVFMGDTGAMALGGALASFAILTKTEVLLAFIGGIYAIEALSVIVQVISFKRSGRRVFLMAPIHHHFEMKAWSETKIMVRFWIVCAILCAIGFVLYYRYYLRFRL